MKKKLSIKAIALGWLIDIIGQTFVTGVVVSLASGVVFWLYLPATRISPQQIEQMAKRWSVSIGFQIIDILGSLLPPVVAGYVAARVAKTSELKHAFAVGILSTLTALLLAFIIPSLGLSELEWGWRDLLYWLLFIPAALLGGYLTTLRARHV